jgi:hypothetical protein
MRLTHLLLIVALLLACAGIAVAISAGSSPLLIASLLGLAGTVVVTYDYPVSGTTPPTISQTGANGANLVSATVFMADTDTTASITHNFAHGPNAPADLFPNPIFFILSPGTAAPIVSWSLTNTNIAVLNKVSASGSGGTYGVVLLRPHTLMR